MQMKFRMCAAGHILLKQKDQYSQLQLMVLSAEDSISHRHIVRTDSKPSLKSYFLLNMYEYIYEYQENKKKSTPQLRNSIILTHQFSSALETRRHRLNTFFFFKLHKLNIFQGNCFPSMSTPTARNVEEIPYSSPCLSYLFVKLLFHLNLLVELCVSNQNTTRIIESRSLWSSFV